jgi:hypothetical protein
LFSFWKREKAGLEAFSSISSNKYYGWLYFKIYETIFHTTSIMTLEVHKQAVFEKVRVQSIRGIFDEHEECYRIAQLYGS